MSAARDLADELAEDLDVLAGSVRGFKLDLDRLIEGARRQDPLLPLLRGRLGELFITTDEMAAGAESLAWRLEEKGEDGDVGGEDDVEIEVEEVES
jgi:hypothetical protein